MKSIKELIQEYSKDFEDIFKKDNKSSILNRRHFQVKKMEDEEFLTGVIVVFLIIVILISIGYYFIIFEPQHEELENLKQDKINHVNNLLKDDESHNKEAIISEIDRTSSTNELEQLDIDSMIYPILKNELMEQLTTYKDSYNRVEVVTDNTTDIMNIPNATNYINSSDVNTLSLISIKPVDSVIIPLSINRKQAASGLITEGDVVDIYKTNTAELIEDSSQLDNETSLDDSKIKTTNKLVGGSKIVSILRSKDSGTVDENIDLSESPQDRNLSQSSTLDIENVMYAKAAGVYDEKQINISLDEYGTRLANYERTSRIGELDVEYIIMIEVPRDSVDGLIDNMDNLILTIPTYDAPGWVKL